MDWHRWHTSYDDPNSDMSRRLGVVQRRIRELLDTRPPGLIRILAMCAGEGRDVFGALESHPRAADVVGRLVEVDEQLAERAARRAPPGLEVVRADAGISDAYAGASPADLVLSCGVFGSVSDEDIRATIAAWRFLCTPGATTIWTRGRDVSDDSRPRVRRWVVEAGFEEVAFDGEPEIFGVGVARMVVAPEAFRRGVRLFQFGSRFPSRASS